MNRAAPPCWHCDLPVTTGERFSADIEGQQRLFCCPACLTVAQTIVAGGFGRYYQLREGSSRRPESDPDPFFAYDDPELQRRFTRRDGDLLGVTLLIGGIHCAACVWLLENWLQRLPGVVEASVSLADQRASVRWREGECRLSEIFAAIAGIGYEPQLYSAERQLALHREEQHRALRRLGVAGLAMMQVGMFAVALYTAGEDGMDPALRHFLRWVSLLVAIPVVAYSAQPFFAGAWRGLRTRNPGMDLPVAVAIGLAFVASAVATLRGEGEVYFDSVAMFTFLLLGSRYLEQRARHRGHQLSADLESLLPATATVIDEQGHARPVPAFRLEPGMHILVRPGQTVPVDACITGSGGSISSAHLTGEFMPRRVEAGDAVTAGSVNGDSPLTLQVTATGADLQINGIDELLQRAQASKPRLAQLADRLASRFVVTVLVLAASTWLAWQLVAPERALWVALSVLVVSCPCALSLATPTALTAAAGRMRRLGLVVANGRLWETLPRITDVVCDKTGTLTLGRLHIERTLALDGGDSEHWLRTAASLEASSEHPIARAFQNHAGGAIARQVDVTPGEGLEGTLDGARLRLGRAAWACELSGAEVPALPGASRSWILLAGTDGPLCWFELVDQPRADAADFVSALRRRGLRVHLLTGDSHTAAATLARELGIETIAADVAPDGKLAYVQTLQQQGARVLMLGDGINDIPVLAAADASLAMSEASDLAKTSADGILVAAGLATVDTLFELASATRQVIRQNLGWALGYNLSAIPLAAMGWIPPWLAAIGMSLSSLLVVLNALRLQRGGRPRPDPTMASSQRALIPERG